jgi:iron(III) transport system permease protein
MRRLERPNVWTAVTILGFLIVGFFLVYPLFNIFKFAFIDKETGILSLSNFKEFFGEAYYPGRAGTRRPPRVLHHAI